MERGPQRQAEPSGAGLNAALVRDLPAVVEVGAGTALLLEGTLDSRARPGSVRVTVAGVSAAPDAERMPAPGALGPGDRWWLLLELPVATPAGVHGLRIEAEVGGRRLSANLGTVTFRDQLPAPAAAPELPAGEQPLICICMATHEPDAERLAVQLDSIRAQTWQRWVCVISDDASSPEARAEIERQIAGDPRFALSPAEERLGFYMNFERALRMVPPEARWVAFADQDDRWDPDKLEALARPLADGGALMSFSDMRIVDEHGTLLSDTYWILRKPAYDDLAATLVANTVTGAASMFERALLETALPFPPPIGTPYHDHWLALCALALGEIAYVPRPTYERVRHLGSVTAHTRHAEALRARRDGVVAEASQRASDAGPGARSIYFESWLQLVGFARVLLERAGPRLTPAKRRALRRTIAAEHNPLATGRLLLRSLRPLFGRDQTLGRERALVYALAWRRLAPGRVAAAYGRRRG